jgi:hypothetical protein
MDMETGRRDMINEEPVMTPHRLKTATIVLGALLAFAPPLWADRDEQPGEKTLRREPAKEFRKSPEPARQRDTARDTRREPAPTNLRMHPANERAREINREPRNEPPARPLHLAQAKEQHRESPKVRQPQPKPPPGHVLDKRHGHNHYYPPRGHVVPVLPPAHRVIHHHHVAYHYHGGIWYRPSGPHFIVVLPPVGIYVPVLPPFYTILWVRTIPYYYAAGVYYTWAPAHHSYVVTEAPPEADIREAQAGSDQLFIYPARGQSEAQQAKDRYECHRWAFSETGYDPSLPGGNVPETRHAGNRSDYFRAMKACLEARGYSVQ